MRSAELDGNFRCLIAADYGLSPRVRVQLYPDIGAKILDLVATDQELIGFVADGSTRLEVSAGRTAPRNFLTCLALTLLEAHRLVTPSMIVGRREIGPVTWYRLNTGWPDHALVQTSTSDLVERQHGYGWVRWTEALDPETGQRRITAPEFELTVTIVSIERETSPLPDVLFTLRLPAMDAS